MSPRTINEAPVFVNATIDFESVAAGSEERETVTVAGAKAGDPVHVSPPNLDAGLMVDAFVSADDTVTVVCANLTAGSIDPGSAIYRLAVYLR